MKLTAVGLCKWLPGDEKAVLLGVATELSEYSFFQRGTVKEFLLFTGRMVVDKTLPGSRQSVKANDYMCHVVVRDSHMAAFVFVDEEYPSRAAMTVAMKAI